MKASTFLDHVEEDLDLKELERLEMDELKETYVKNENKLLKDQPALMRKQSTFADHIEETLDLKELEKMEIVE